MEPSITLFLDRGVHRFYSLSFISIFNNKYSSSVKRKYGLSLLYILNYYLALTTHIHNI